MELIVTLYPVRARDLSMSFRYTDVVLYDLLFTTACSRLRLWTWTTCEQQRSRQPLCAGTLTDLVNRYRGHKQLLQRSWRERNRRRLDGLASVWVAYQGHVPFHQDDSSLDAPATLLIEMSKKTMLSAQSRRPSGQLRAGELNRSLSGHNGGRWTKELPHHVIVKSSGCQGAPAGD